MYKRPWLAAQTQEGCVGDGDRGAGLRAETRIFEVIGAAGCWCGKQLDCGRHVKEASEVTSRNYRSVNPHLQWAFLECYAEQPAKEREIERATQRGRELTSSVGCMGRAPWCKSSQPTCR
jgi:hypothetical protein